MEKGTVSESVSNSLTQATELSHDIQRLEVSIGELHDLFVQMSVQVEQQSELLNQIQYQVERSQEFLDQGNEDLTAVIAQRKKGRGVCCSCCWILFG
jgi:syntaxin 1B/2/3